MSSQEKTAGQALSARESLFVNALHSAQIDEPLPRATWALYLMAAALTAAVTWSSIAQVDEIARCEGRIVPDGREQVIASLESGILRELYVREGMEVEAGQPLAQMDPTRVEASQNENQVKRLALMAQASRLRAEVNGSGLSFPPEVKEQPRLLQSETEAFESRRRLVDESVQSINRSIALVMRELKISQDMAAKGLMSDVELMRLNRQVNELQQQRSERSSRFRQEAASELVKIQNELAQVDEQMIVKQDAMTRTVLKSPVRGVVKSVKISTVGGVIGSGATIMEISPLGPRVLIEARVKPRDIGFVRVGQDATVKLSGYDYNINGGLEGKVDYISPDAMGEIEKTAENGYYRAIVASDRNTLVLKGKPLPVIPGMAATVEIKTGERSVLSYLLRPLLKSREALRER